MEENGVVRDLILESKEHLKEIIPALHELEQKGKNISTEMVNRIYRAIHSITEKLVFSGYQDITRLSHSIETVLSGISEQQLTISDAVVDTLRNSIDTLQFIFDNIKNIGTIQVDKEISALAPFKEAVTKQRAPDKVIKSDIKSDVLRFHNEFSQDIMDESVKGGKSIYRILLSSRRDLDNKNITFSALFEKWECLGKILDFAMDLDSIEGLSGSSEKELLYSVIYATALEPDLFMTGLNVSLSQIRIINPADFATDTVQSASAVSDDMAPPVAILPLADTKTGNGEESLRVKIEVLNSLMNLSSELGLSRNQLQQLFNRKLADIIDKNKISAEFDKVLALTAKNIIECAHNTPAQLETTIKNQTTELKKYFVKLFSMPLKGLHGVSSALHSIDTITNQLQKNILQTRLQTLSILFGKFPRIIREMSRTSGKQIELSMFGNDIELDKSVIDMLSVPLIHLIRNCADYGIEMPDERIKAGKNPTGTVYIRASHEGTMVIIKIEDDGMGLDVENIRNTAINCGFITEMVANSLSNREICRLIMQAGFSAISRDRAPDGRGSSMHTVRTTIERLGGTIDIESESGLGMTVTLSLPMTVAIVPSLIISVENKNYALPQGGVEELVQIKSFEVTKKIEHRQGFEVTRLHGAFIPLIRLSNILELPNTFIHPETKESLSDKRTRFSDRRTTTEESAVRSSNQPVAMERRKGADRRVSETNEVKIVIVKTGTNHFGLIVNSVFDNEDIVVKPIPEHFKATPVYAGTTILEDGKDAMILDPTGIALKAGLHFSDLDKK